MKRQQINPGFGFRHVGDAFKPEGLGDDADGEASAFARGFGDDGRGAGACAAAHSRGDEDHVGVFQERTDVVERLFGGGASDFGIKSGAEAACGFRAEGDAVFGLHGLERLAVGVAGEEFNIRQRVLHHRVDGVAAAAADADDEQFRTERHEVFGAAVVALVFGD